MNSRRARAAAAVLGIGILSSIAYWSFGDVVRTKLEDRLLVRRMTTVLALSDDQRQQIEPIVQEEFGRLRDLRGRTASGGITPLMAARVALDIEGEFEERVVAVLSQDQVDAYARFHAKVWDRIWQHALESRNERAEARD